MAIGVLFAFCATARIIDSFHGWDKLINNSQYIAVVDCGNSVPTKPNILTEGATKSDREIKVILTLKGTNTVNPTRLLTDYEICSGKKYLVFGYCNESVYCAYEEFRVVPLNKFFSTNLLSGKNLDDQIQILIELRINDLNRQLKQEQEEKQRLEERILK